MGRNRRRRGIGTGRSHDDDNNDTRSDDDATHVLLESIRSDDKAIKVVSPPVWSIEYVDKIEKKVPDPIISNDTIQSIMEIGLQLVRGALDKISNRNFKKSTKNTSTPPLRNSQHVKPTPIQLRLWPALLSSFDARECSGTSPALNVVGIAPTGTGKTMSYVVPIISLCTRTLLCQMHNQQSNFATRVHGLVLAPTRELAIQISKEFNVAAKVANKYMAKCVAGADNSDPIVKSISVYGGVDIDSQIASLTGQAESACQQSIVVVATPGRLLDILKQTNAAVSSAFANLHVVVFDEADRIAVNSEMAMQVDDILSILKSIRDSDDELISCLVSATLPEKATEMCNKWVPRPRIIIRVNHVTVGEKPTMTAEDNGDGDVEGHVDEASSSIPKAEHGKKSVNPQNLDLASIPSNIVQTLHVCSNHKKPKKLILTLQRIYMKKDKGSGRFTTNNQLTIVFFSQIKTVKYVSQLLVKEGLKCVELYGSLHQTEREKRLLEFKSGKVPILLATDIAARGIHIANVNYVVNYDFPGSLDQYVHRCGRAGRKQSRSEDLSPPTVFSFFTREFSAMASSVIELLKACNSWVDPNLLALTEDGTSPDKKQTNNDSKTRKRKHNAADSEGGKDNGDESDNDQFAFLGRSVLKRASHVSDAEDSEDEDSS